ncbi:MAG: DUF1877 family protein [Bacteroidota bacterium]
MLYRGVFQAIPDQQLKELKRLKRDSERRSFIDNLDENISKHERQDTDKSWYLLFVTLHSGNHSNYMLNDEMIDLSKIFIGSKSLHRADFYIINWISRNDLNYYSEILNDLNSEILFEKYISLNSDWFHKGDYKKGDYKNSKEQFDYIYFWLEKIKKFFSNLVGLNKHVIFSSQYQ